MRCLSIGCRTADATGRLDGSDANDGCSRRLRAESPRSQEAVRCSFLRGCPPGGLIARSSITNLRVTAVLCVVVSGGHTALDSQDDIVERTDATMTIMSSFWHASRPGTCWCCTSWPSSERSYVSRRLDLDLDDKAGCRRR